MTLNDPNLVFKVTPFFDNEYLTNGYRYGYSYYNRRQIGNRTQAFEWHQFQWHGVTSNPDFKGRILFNVKKTRKWYKIKLYLQWPTIESRIWSIERRHFQWPWTTPNLVFKVTPFFDTDYLTNGYRYGHSYYRKRIETTPKLSTGTNFNDLEWHLTHISRLR